MPAAPALAFDLVVLADPRQRFAEGRCLAALLAVAAGRGYRVGLVPVLPPSPSMPGRAFHPRVAGLLGGGAVALLDGERPHRARLALVHHLPAARHPPERPLAIRAERVLLRVDQPWRSAGGTPLLHLRAALDNVTALCGLRPALVANDALLAARLAEEGLAPVDLWPPTSDLAAAPERGGEAQHLLVGRHVAGGEGAWPTAAEELAAAYLPPEGPRTRLAEEAARPAPVTARPAPWTLDVAELDDPAAYLAGLDAYLLATAEGWRPLLLPGLAEALAVGVPLVAPPALEPVLGGAAVYARPAEAPAALAGLTQARRSELRAAARALHDVSTGPAALAARLERHLGPPAAAAPGLTLRRDLRARRRVLFLSPNGIGMGHLTRLLAVARRCGPDLEPVFLSMSQGIGVVGSMGYLGEYFPFHAHTGETAEAWNAALRARLDEAIAFHDARCVVFDGNVPYQGLVDCRQAHPNRAFVWIRRPLWRRDAGRATVGRARHFDLVIEPGELAADLDPGPTAGRREEAVQVPPVLLLDPDELPDRAAARAELGLDPGRTAVLVQLGSRNNYDYAAVDQVLVEELGRRPEVEPVFVDWLIGETDRTLPDHVRRLRAFPTARFLRAFDLAVSAAGYNSFHELLRFGVPAVFVPNENPMMDAQELRALWAERHGLAHLVRRHDPYRLAWAVRSLLDPSRRAEIAARCAAAVPPCDGAARIARRVEELAAGVRLPPGADRLPHGLTRGV